ncbi:MAG: Hint domain-containing protein [Pseudomonadota bacterium]
MPSVFIISAGSISATDNFGQATTLGQNDQGAGSHLGTITIDADASYTRVEIDDQGGRTDYLEDSTSSQSLEQDVTIDGVFYSEGTSVENEYQITLQDQSGNSYVVWALEIEDGVGPGYNNVVGLMFKAGKVPPFGQTLQVTGSLDLYNIPSNNADEFFYATGVTCFTAGMRVDTPVGPVAVEKIRPGMKVWTLDNGPQEVIWTGHRALGYAELQSYTHLKPVIIQKGALGNTRVLQVSRQHRLALTETSSGCRVDPRRFARATLLADQPGVRLRHANGCRKVNYVHFMCEAHQVVRTEGLLSETFYPGKQAMMALDAPARAEICALFPELLHSDQGRQDALHGYGRLARSELTRGELRELSKAA